MFVHENFEIHLMNWKDYKYELDLQDQLQALFLPYITAEQYQYLYFFQGRVQDF